MSTSGTTTAPSSGHYPVPGIPAPKVVWGYLAVLAVLTAVTAAAFLPTVRSLLVEWNDMEQRTYTHGYLVAGLCFWLLFRSRLAIARDPGRPSLAAFPLLILLAAASVIVLRSGIEIGHQLMLPVLLWTAILVALGWKSARHCLFPLAYLYFAIPIWSHFNGVLQLATIWAVRLMLRATGVSAYFEGDLVEVPGGVFQIADGCSGLHFLVVALALAALYGEVQRDRLRVRLRHLALAGMLAILGNWLRVYTLIVVGYVTDMQHYLVKVDHYYFGWGVFAVAMTVFFVVSRRLDEDVEPVSDAFPRVTAESRCPSVLPTLVAIFGVAFIPAAVAALSRGSPAATVSIESPAGLPQWMGPSGVIGDWNPVFAGADAEIQHTYTAGSAIAELYIAAYARQQQGKELIGYSNSVAGGLRELDAGRRTWHDVQINERLVESSSKEQWIVWSVYEVGSRPFVSGVAAELWYGIISLVTVPESRVIAVRSRCLPDCDAARTALSSFLDQAALVGR